MILEAEVQSALEAFSQAFDLDREQKPFAANQWATATPPLPVLHLEDVSAIPFLTDIAGVEEYQHRARVRAETGDLYATVTPSDPAYDEYCAERLGLGRPRWLAAKAGRDPLAVARACLEGPALPHLVETARSAGGLVIHPYMSIAPVWELAGVVARESRQRVTVLGSTPPVTWVANDKERFTQLVDLVLGPGWTTETRPSRDPAQLAVTLGEFATRHDAIGLKRTRCASAMGNLVLRSREVRQQPHEAVRQTVQEFLARTDWAGDEPVLVVAWEDAVSSPSTQWWIPPLHTTAPRLDGIFEQILEGDRRVFVGSRPSTLPRAVNQTITWAARRVAHALQALGYVGRCSFDHLVLGDPSADFSIRFTECNGRWGGTSTPMHLVDRVTPGPRPPYRAQDFTHQQLADVSFHEILDRLGPDLFDPAGPSGRFILYNVGPLAMHGKLDVIAMGPSQAEAEQALLADLPRRLAL